MIWTTKFRFNFLFAGRHFRGGPHFSVELNNMLPIWQQLRERSAVKSQAIRYSQLVPAIRRRIAACRSGSTPAHQMALSFIASPITIPLLARIMSASGLAFRNGSRMAAAVIARRMMRLKPLSWRQLIPKTVGREAGSRSLKHTIIAMQTAHCFIKCCALSRKIFANAGRMVMVNGFGNWTSGDFVPPSGNFRIP